jgi:TRAP-type uncharacterized transport system substrate-binding protein
MEKYRMKSLLTFSSLIAMVGYSTIAQAQVPTQKIDTKKVTICSGATNQGFHALAVMMQDTLKEKEGIDAEVVTDTGGTRKNFEFGMNPVAPKCNYWIGQGEGYIDYKKYNGANATKVVTLGKGFLEAIVVVCDASKKIKDLSSLADSAKNSKTLLTIAVGSDGSGASLALDTMIQAGGPDFDPLKNARKYEPQDTAILTSTSCALVVGSPNYGVIQGLESKKGLVVLDLDEKSIQAKHPITGRNLYQSLELPKKDYPNLHASRWSSGKSAMVYNEVFANTSTTDAATREKVKSVLIQLNDRGRLTELTPYWVTSQAREAKF